MRGYLADRLECAVKRISKKFEGTSYNGRKQYRSGSVVLLPEDAQKRQSNLQEMRTTFKESRSALLQTKKSKTLVKSKGATKSRAAKSKKGAAKPTFTPGVGSVGLRDTPHTNAAPQSLLTSSTVRRNRLTPWSLPGSTNNSQLGLHSQMNQSLLIAQILAGASPIGSTPQGLSNFDAAPLSSTLVPHNDDYLLSLLTRTLQNQPGAMSNIVSAGAIREILSAAANYA